AVARPGDFQLPADTAGAAVVVVIPLADPLPLGFLQTDVPQLSQRQPRTPGYAHLADSRVIAGERELAVVDNHELTVRVVLLLVGLDGYPGQRLPLGRLPGNHHTGDQWLHFWKWGTLLHG